MAPAPHRVRPLQSADRDAWLRMRGELWPDVSTEDLAPDVDAFIWPGDDVLLSAVFVSEDEAGQLRGFLELYVREYAEGCDGPTPYVEGWYVAPSARGNGVGRELMRAAEDWSRTNGYKELASDTEIHNEGSQRAHAAIGFDEVERIVVFRKPVL